MSTEIERKFLVTGKVPSGESSEIHQAYLCLDPERTSRVRVDGESAFLTIKGRTEGISRREFEFEIPLEHAHGMLDLAVGFPILKTRTRVKHGNHTWEVDVFHGVNTGLIVAEVELSREDEDIVLPDWVGDEVSDDSRYLNAVLAQNPFSEWPAEF